MSDTRSQPEATGGGKWQVLLLFAGGGLLALFLALQIGDASLRDGVYHPVSNDAFYHARRIIDTAGERGFYEFDDTIHVPEGSQITWPWAYDYLMGQALRVFQALNSDAHPMSFLAFVPPIWLLLNVALFVALTGAAGLSTGLRAVATLAYGLFPLNQLIHGVGAIDHHFVEHSFVLASTLLAIRWAADFSSRGNAIWLAAVLGAATAFHNGLFILQLPVLIALGLLWLRGQTFDRDAAMRFAITLPLVTLVTALPSQPLQDFAFDYGLLSWFHVYVSVCSAAMVVFWSRSAFSSRSLAGGGALALLLSLPILFTAAGGIAFISGDILLHDRIEEARSPFRGIFEPHAAGRLSILYSAQIFAAPLFVVWFGWRLLVERGAPKVMLFAAAIFGLILMSTQIRLQYFGSFALMLAVPLMLQQHLPEFRQRALVATMLGFGVVAAASQRPISHQLFARQNLSFDIDYELGVGMLETLADACEANPGLALASNNFGHPVRYHSDCSVLANNFLLTRQHEEKIEQLTAAWAMTPEQLLVEMPEVRYVLVVLSDIYLYTDTGLREPTLDELAGSNPPLAMALTFQANLPAQYELLDERPLDDGRDFAVARLFSINMKTNALSATGNADQRD